MLDGLEARRKLSYLVLGWKKKNFLEIHIAKCEFLGFLGTVSIMQMGTYLMGREVSVCS